MPVITPYHEHTTRDLVAALRSAAKNLISRDTRGLLLEAAERLDIDKPKKGA